MTNEQNSPAVAGQVERHVRREHEDKAAEFKRSLAGADYCTYPECRCPFDHPGEAGWCAVGLPQSVPNRQLKRALQALRLKRQLGISAGRRGILCESI